MSRSVINVSNRLPVTVKGDEIRKSSGGLVTALEGAAADLKWIGWTGNRVDDPQRRQALSERFARELGYTPIFLSDQESRDFYEGFSNSSLWPLLHYLPSYMRYEPRWWAGYRQVNQHFADAVLSVARDGDRVWVHDYQLMLVPRLLREVNPSLRVGFFLHTPFPSYEIFRCHPNRMELIEGLLGADQIGFHTFGYLRHFRSTVLRLLGTESELTRIRRDGHTSHLGVYPIGINAQRFEKQLDSAEHRAQVERFRTNFAGKRIILSVERMDYTKGIPHRLDAIEQFLHDNPQHRDDMKFIFISVPSRERVEEYQVLVSEVESRIGRINGTYATVQNSPIHFIHGSVSFAELTALYALAEAALVTPLRDGMNLVAKEYVAAQREGTGVLVLSEFAGAAEELFSALIVNPNDAQGVAGCLRDALDMPADERRQRMAPMRQRVMRHDAAAWARSFLDELASRPKTDEVAHSHAEAERSIRNVITRGGRIAMFLDYDGTLRELVRDPAAATPTPDMLDLFHRLRQLEVADVTIISGRMPQDLETFLGSLPFGLIAEHGAALRRPGSEEWERLDRNASYTWKRELLKVLKLYEASTPGSWVEEKRTSLVWHYRNADPEFGKDKARNLAEELSTIAANEPIQIRHGSKIVEVTSTHINKGAAVSRVLEQRSYDLIVVVGDDTTDESMFRLNVRNLVSIKVGDGDTQARYRVPTPAALRGLLLRAISTWPPLPATGASSPQPAGSN